MEDLFLPVSSKLGLSPSLPQFLVELTFLEAARGADKELSVELEDACPRCDGRGSEPGTKLSMCYYCNGTGVVSSGEGERRSRRPVPPALTLTTPACGAPCRSPSAPAHT